MKLKCTNCVNCDYVRGFMCNCHCSYDEEKDGAKYHVQCGQYVHVSHANKCEHYSEEPYDRDKFFIL